MIPVRFDQVPERLAALGREVGDKFPELKSILVIRDLWGRIRFLVPERPEPGSVREKALAQLALMAQDQLGAFGMDAEQSVLYGDEIALDLAQLKREPSLLLETEKLQIRLIDRQVTNGSWATIFGEDPGSKIRRLAFYSLKGGVGRSTATAFAGWKLAQAGHSVLILDLDLEAPGISTSVLPADSRPDFGIVDWFVEDAVGQGDSVVERMTARSPLSSQSRGELWVAPSHGLKPGDFVAKLGRAFLDLPGSEGTEAWQHRLKRLLTAVEDHRRPDVVLIDARSGFHDLASTAVTELADTVLLFAVGSEQTWNGYRLLFDHWSRFGVAESIRERLQIVSALVPETDREAYFAQFQEKSWELFSEFLYDEVEAGALEGFSFDLNDSEAPHTPLPIYWNRGLAEMKHLETLDEQLVEAAAGKFLAGIEAMLADVEEIAE